MYPSTATERLGVAAGVVVTALLVGLVFVGPWRALALDGTGTVPISAVENARGNPFLAGAVGTMFVGFVTGCAYPLLVDPADEEFERGDLGMGIFVPPLVAVLLVLLGALLSPAVGSLMAGTVGEAAAQGAVGLVFGLLFATLAATVVAVYVGLPALVGVFAGVQVGLAAASERS